MFTALAIGPILNIRFGPRPPSHYALSLFAAIIGAVVSTRQILLHIMPGDAGYGSALLGYHYYTWALLGFIAAIVLLAAILLFDSQFEKNEIGAAKSGGRVRARCSLACHRPHRGKRDLDLAGMRLRRVPRRSGRLRAAQGHALEFVDKDIQGPADATTGRSLRRCRLVARRARGASRDANTVDAIPPCRRTDST